MAATRSPLAIEVDSEMPSIDLIEARIAQLHLAEFNRMAWPIVEKRAYSENWHIEVIAEHLEAVSRGELQRLIINIPPRHMKSLSVAVFWPCWDWLTHPERQWLFASYAEKLSKRDSVKSRRIIESRGGRRVGGTLLERVGYYGLLDLLGDDWRLAGDQNEKLKFENTANGYRLATSVGGTATGEGGDILVMDDLHKADEAESELRREEVIDFLDGTLSTRLNDPKKSAIVVVMQRLHEDDATGHLLEQGGYHHLCLPAEYEPSHPFVCPPEFQLPDQEVEHDDGEVTVRPGRVLPGDPREEAGELIWRARFGPAELVELKKRLGTYRTAGQLQQRPSPEEGGILKRFWWRYYPAAWLDGDEWPEAAPTFQRIWQSWDTALKEKTSNDYTVGGLWGQDLANKYLLREVRGRFSLTETKTQIEAMTKWADDRFPQHEGHQKRVENTANGPEVLTALRDKIPGLVPVTVDTDKVSRAYSITPQLEAGNVKLPGRMNADANGPDASCPAWVLEFVDENAAFPNGSYDDQVDMTTQALSPTVQIGRPRKPRSGGRDKGKARRNR